MSNLFTRTQPASRNYAVAFLAGIMGGLIAAFVKSGMEGVMPPRMPNRVAPTVQIIQDMGIDMHNMVYIYSDQVVNWGGNVVHILFSIVWAVIYCMAAEIFPKVKLWQGLAFGIGVTILFHGMMLPVLNLSPALWNLPFDELFSELVGTLLWMWTIEVFRHDLSSRLTKKSDPEFQ
ncbi:YagU family protein [Snodgrassella alvi]|jgi:putative membrane protein|uniref:DUF1440 domain-containing protein n=1 Tax=Snodgrassella alvi TaxID=1196083 RepID=A0A2N9XXZ0_9NEIS|nr:DUF1440 domain-containing protein [Snodgrassella alvi]PIT55037.1 hypothetical protein BHC49_07060 [Snodgrassella alvi]